MNRGRRVVAAAIALALSLAGLGLVALANHAMLDDPDDTRGLLDIRRVQLHGAERPRWNVITWQGWTTAETWDAGYVLVLLDTLGDQRADYYVLAGSTGDGMYADLWRDRVSRSDRRISGVNVWRPSKTSVAVKVPLRKLKLGERRTFYRWRIETIFTSERCRRACFDLAPDEGFIVQPLDPGGPTPLPTITLTPQPTPSSSG